MELINSIFDYKSYMPNGYCFLWVPEILWTQVIADFAISIACFIISFTIFYLIFKRRALPTSWVFVLFAIFLTLTGLTHLISMLTVWYPIYAFEAIIKLITGATSIGTAFMMFPLIPKIMQILKRLDQAPAANGEK